MGWGEAVRIGEGKDASARFFLSAIYPVLRYFASVCVRHRARAFLSPLQLVGASSVERVACSHHRRSASSRLTALVRGSDRRVVSEPLCRCVGPVLLLRQESSVLLPFRVQTNVFGARGRVARSHNRRGCIVPAIARRSAFDSVPQSSVCPSVTPLVVGSQCSGRRESFCDCARSVSLCRGSAVGFALVGVRWTQSYAGSVVGSRRRPSSTSDATVRVPGDER